MLRAAPVIPEDASGRGVAAVEKPPGARRRGRRPAAAPAPDEQAAPTSRAAPGSGRTVAAARASGRSAVHGWSSPGARRLGPGGAERGPETRSRTGVQRGVVGEEPPGRWEESSRVRSAVRSGSSAAPWRARMPVDWWNSASRRDAGTAVAGRGAGQRRYARIPGTSDDRRRHVLVRACIGATWMGVSLDMRASCR